MKNLTWEDGFMGLLWASLASLLVLFIVFVFADKYTIKYSLGQSGSAPTIIREVAWFQDDNIPLDRSVTVSQAIALVDSLNKTLK